MKPFGRTEGMAIRAGLWILLLGWTLLGPARGAGEPAGATSTVRQYLSGRDKDNRVLWQFFCTGGRNSGFWTQIPVPSCWETEGFGSYDYGVEHLESTNSPAPPPLTDEQGLYRHVFRMPPEWKGRDIRLVFEGVMTDTEVRLNGRVAGPVHQGGFYRFSHDVTALVDWERDNLLEVTVSKKSANPGVNEAERRGDYWNFGGIFRPVYVEARPVEAIARVAIDAAASGQFRARVHLSRPAGPGLRIRVRIRPAGGVATAGVESVPVEISPGALETRIATSVPNPATWTAETPRLYEAEFDLLRGGAVCHQLEQRFGFRTFEVRPGQGLYLNGARVVMKGVNRHSFWPESGRTLSAAVHQLDVRLIKDANMNAVRMSHYPPDEAFLDACDEAGLYVLNELGGWHGAYDTPTARRLIASLVARDVNHPSILLWDNGNEGGGNPEADDEFARHDPQGRPVLHPWGVSSGINTAHYRSYDETRTLSEGPDLFMPTEFLHGLYDGGHGAGLDDYWPLMSRGSNAAGGFLWTLFDEGLVRTDWGGRIDARRNLGPDGLLGPHREREASYATVKEIWSPVQIPLPALPVGFSGRLPLENSYAFTSLDQVSFEWVLLRTPQPGSTLSLRAPLRRGELKGPAVPPGGTGSLTLPLPEEWRQADLLEVTARDAVGRDLRSWTWPCRSLTPVADLPVGNPPARCEETPEGWTLSAARVRVKIDRRTGGLAGLEREGRRWSLGEGPRWVAYRRVGSTFQPLMDEGRIVQAEGGTSGDAGVVTIRRTGGVQELRWTLLPSGDLRVEYAYRGPGVVHLLGLDFSYPEERIRSKDWLGAGPARVWQNRTQGVQWGRWEVDFNDPEPGRQWLYPEFKGWFRDWAWITFDTTEGRIAFLNDGGNPYFGVFTPRDGRITPLLSLPVTGLGVYQVIPAIGTKTSAPEDLGPGSQPRRIEGTIRGAFRIRLLDP